MKRWAAVVLMLAGMTGNVTTALAGPYQGDVWKRSGAKTTAFVPGAVGPWGQPIPMAAPYAYAPVSDSGLAKSMINMSMPLNQIQLANYSTPGGLPISPPGIPAAPSMGLPGGVMPAGGPGMMLPPGAGMPPGAGLPPGPGMPLPMGGPAKPGAVAAIGALTGPGAAPFPVSRTEVFFTSPLDMKVTWYVPGPDGKPQVAPQSLDAPARYNFLQAAIYRLKLSGIPGRPGLELYPTLEVVPGNAKTMAFLSHSAVPVAITEDDLDQVQAGNYLVKVIYLPDPQYQDLAVTGPSAIVSSQLEPGVDPIAEACRRGSILLVLRMGNIHLELPHTPAMDSPGPLGMRPQSVLPPGTATVNGPNPTQPNVPPAGNPLFKAPFNPLMPFGNPTPTPSPTTTPTPATPTGKAPGTLPSSITPVNFQSRSR